MLFCYFNVACKGQIIGLNYSSKVTKEGDRSTRQVHEGGKNKQTSKQPASCKRNEYPIVYNHCRLQTN